LILLAYSHIFILTSGTIFVKGGLRLCEVDRDYELWQKYKNSHDPKIREQLILKYTPYVKYIANRVGMGLPPNVEVEDLYGYGIFGLIDAIEKFEPQRQIQFKTYAQTRIRGSILDELRKLDWTPRSVRQKARQLEKAYVHLENNLGRAATDEEIAEYMKISLEELYEWYKDTRGSFLLSLDDLLYSEDDGVTVGDSVPASDADNPQNQIEQKELKQMLVKAINALAEREKLVLTLYYYEEMTLKEIGAILNVSDSRVSQLHTKAILKLRAKLSMSKKGSKASEEK